ncbi:MAG: UDP-glucose/GDP-mannose dehydrogenase family protein [Myxococcales bacterium]|nr:UDP-glucose/GDP-mannose dehydrogenase family protein [Myxococcales bacterium]
MKLAIAGSGYVGLVAGTCFAHAGHAVTLVDVDQARVDTLLEGVCPFWEPGLPELLTRVRQAGRLSATTDLAGAIRDADALFVAVGTPQQPDGSADLSAVETVVDAVVQARPAQLLLVVKSTVVPGTADRLAASLAAAGIDGVEVVSNPEFLKQGDAVRDFTSPDRVIVGVRSREAAARMRAIYAPFLVRSQRIQIMDPVSAELTKYASNAMLASRVSFMNDVARLCEALGADVGAVRRGMGSDRRIGQHFLYASLGYGGSCFPKDVAALSALGRQLGAPQTLVEATARANENQRAHIARRALAALGPEPRGKRAAVWGLAFKPRTDDVRQSAALALVEVLRQASVHCVLHDPAALANATEVLGEHGISTVEDPLDALHDAHLLVIATEWQPYRSLDLQQLVARMARPVIVDGRNVYDPAWFVGTPVTYHSVGRATTGGDGHRLDLP